MYLLKNKNNEAFSKFKGGKIIFLNLDDAEFLRDCIKEEMQIEYVETLPTDSVICEIKGLN